MITELKQHSAVETIVFEVVPSDTAERWLAMLSGAPAGNASTRSGQSAPAGDYSPGFWLRLLGGGQPANGTGENGPQARAQYSADYWIRLLAGSK